MLISNNFTYFYLLITGKLRCLVLLETYPVSYRKTYYALGKYMFLEVIKCIHKFVNQKKYW